MLVHIRRGQGPARPQRAAQPQTTRRPARVLALDEAGHLCVSRRGGRPPRGCARLRQDRLARLPRGRSSAPASPSACIRTPCGTVTPPTCWKPAPISPASRNCSATPTSATPPSICILSRKHSELRRQPARRASRLLVRHRARQGEASQEMNPPPIEVADIVRASRRRLRRKEPALAALVALSRCCAPSRVAALPPSAAIAISAPGCGHQASSYNSCRNRHCPEVPGGRPRQMGRQAANRGAAHGLLPRGLHSAA